LVTGPTVTQQSQFRIFTSSDADYHTAPIDGGLASLVD